MNIFFKKRGVVTPSSPGFGVRREGLLPLQTNITSFGFGFAPPLSSPKGWGPILLFLSFIIFLFFSFLLFFVGFEFGEGRGGEEGGDNLSSLFHSEEFNELASNTGLTVPVYCTFNELRGTS